MEALNVTTVDPDGSQAVNNNIFDAAVCELSHCTHANNFRFGTICIFPVQQYYHATLMDSQFGCLITILPHLFSLTTSEFL